METPFYQKLKSRCKNNDPLKTVIIHPTTSQSLAGAIAASEEGLIEPILVGPKHKILAAAQEADLDISTYRCIDTEHSHMSASKGLELIRTGEAMAVMKGHIHTDELMQAVVDKRHNLRTERRMSHVFVVDVLPDDYHKPLFISDAAINIAPDLTTKKDIIQNSIDLFSTCGFGVPKVAILSATEQITDKIPSTIEAAALSKMADRGWISGGLVDGPLAFDNAISKEAARIKGLNSEVAGDADILIVPDIESGNILYKQMRYLSGYDAAGIVMGAKVPIILTSRAGSVRARLASCALAQLYCSNQTL